MAVKAGPLKTKMTHCRRRVTGTRQFVVTFTSTISPNTTHRLASLYTKLKITPKDHFATLGTRFAITINDISKNIRHKDCDYRQAPIHTKDLRT